MPFIASLLFLAAGTPYRWKSVQIVGAGLVDGVVFHPKAKGVRYARTDMGGAYRWDGTRWAAMLDWIPYKDLNLMGVESIAVDPSDPEKVVLACGTYTDSSTPEGAILRSGDGGRTFEISRVPIKFGGNEIGRGNGERMAVDPHDPRRLLLGTRHAGLWRSDDGAATWRRVDSLPSVGGARGAGLVVTLFDPASKGVAYVAVSNDAGPTIFRTTDGGTTWNPIAGGPAGLFPTHMALDDGGALWVTYATSPGPYGTMTNGAVWKVADGAWTDVTPEKPNPQKRFGYAAVSVQKGAAIVSTSYRPQGEQIFRTTDGGATWRPTIGGKETYDHRKAPYQARTGIHWLSDVEIDPFNPDHAVFTTGYGGHETFDLTAADRGKPVHWQALATGIEESVALSLVSPTRGAHLVSGIGDYGGFVHRDLDRPAPEGSFVDPQFGNTSGIAAGDFAPETIVRVGRSSGGREANLGYSLDGGAHWHAPASMPPNAREGHVAVSPDGTTWIWSLREGAYWSDDNGATWTLCDDLPKGLRVVADRVSVGRFYALDLFADKLYVSADGGKRFEERELALPGGPPRPGSRGDERGGQDLLYSTPGRSGDLWIAAFDGLYHATTAREFVRMPAVSEIHAFGFGKAAPGRLDPTLYLVGTVNGQRGIFRSDDSGATWTRINDDAHQWGLVLLVTGDPKKYGRVYVGTHGRGTFYGDPR